MLDQLAFGRLGVLTGEIYRDKRKKAIKGINI